MSYTTNEYKYGYWIIFGEHKDGHVDVQSEPTGATIVTHVSRPEAELLVTQHNTMVGVMDGFGTLAELGDPTEFEIGDARSFTEPIDDGSI